MQKTQSGGSQTLSGLFQAKISVTMKPASNLFWKNTGYSFTWTSSTVFCAGVDPEIQFGEEWVLHDPFPHSVLPRPFHTDWCMLLKWSKGKKDDTHLLTYSFAKVSLIILWLQGAWSVSEQKYKWCCTNSTLHYIHAFVTFWLFVVLRN